VDKKLFGEKKKILLVWFLVLELTM